MLAIRFPSSAGIAALLLFTAAAPAQTTYSWATAASGNYGIAANWTPGGGPPGFADTVNITATGSAYTITLNDSRSITDFTLNSANATFAHTAGIYTLDGTMTLNAGVYNLNGGTIAGGTITGAAGRLVVGTTGGSTLSNVQIGAGVLDLSTASGRLTLTGGTNFNTASTYTTGDNFTLTVNQAAAVNNLDLSLAKGSTVVATSFTLGAGSVLRSATTYVSVNQSPLVAVSASSTFTNRGLVLLTGDDLFRIGNTTGTVSNVGVIRNIGGLESLLSINPTTFVNQTGGLIEARNGNVVIGGAWVNRGVIRLEVGARVFLSGTFNSLDIGIISRGGLPVSPGTDGTLSIVGTLTLNANFDLHATTGPLIAGGPLPGFGTSPPLPTGLAVVEGNGFVLSSSGGSRYRAESSELRNVQIAPNSLDLQGDLTLTAGSNFTAPSVYTLVGSLKVNQPTPIANLDLTIGNNGFAAAGNLGFTLSPSSTLRAAGSSNAWVLSSHPLSGPSTFTIQGVVLNSGTGVMTVGGGTGTVSNAGTLRNAAGGSLRINPGQFTVQVGGHMEATSGTIVIANSVSFSNYTTGTLTGGTYQVTFATMDWGTRTVHTLAAGTAITLVGATTSFPAIDSGSLTTVSGTLSVGGGKTLTVAAGGLTVTSGGVLTGHQGVIVGRTVIQSGGKIAPGSSPGVITISGGLELGGLFEHDISPPGGNTNSSNTVGNNTPGQGFDVIVVRPLPATPTAPTHVTVRSSLSMKVVAADTALNSGFWSAVQKWTLLRTTNGLILDAAGNPLPSGTAVSATLVNRDSGQTIDFSAFGSFSFDVLVLGNDGAGQRGLDLVWTPVPEPAGVVAVCVAALGVVAAARRRWKRTPEPTRGNAA